MSRTPIAHRPPARPQRQPSSSASRRWKWRWLLFPLLVGAVLLAGWMIHLDTVVREKFSGQRWTIPAKVYARPLEVFAGARLSRDDFLTELDALGYRRGKTVQGPGDVVIGAQNIELHSRGFQFYEAAEPARRLRVAFAGNHVASVSEPGKGDVPVARLEPLLIGGIYPAHNEDRILVQLEEVPPLLTGALIAVEDRDFYHHWGVSPKSIMRAMWVNAGAGAVVQGGSTLTQQLVKNFFLSNERSFSRKINEALMAPLLELHYDKREILEAYLNEVFLGQDGQRAVHGFGLASQYFFAQPLSELRLPHIALLAGLVKGPSYYDPRRHPERALERRNLVLDVMADQGLVSKDDAEKAKKTPLGISARGSLANSSFPAFLDFVKRQLRQDYREQDLTEEGLRIFTSFDPILQLKAETALEETFKRLKADSVEAAMVIAHPQTGEVQALLGGRQARFAGFNRALDAQRPIGSLVKPAVYLTALERPSEYSLTTRLLDEPFSVRLPDGQQWEPENYDHKAHGPLFLYEALANSYNLSTTRLGMALGVENVLKTVRRLGVEVNWPAYPSILLGAGELSPMQVTTLYQTIANGGFNSPLHGIRSVLSGKGEPLKGYPYEVQQRFDPGSIYLLQQAMQRVMREGTARSVYNQLPSSLIVAGKTGTTNDSRDSWFAGFSQDVLAVVWMGRDDNGKTTLTGATGALQAWTGFMRRVQPSSLDNTPPDNIQSAWVDSQTGQGSAADCAGAIQMPYIRGSEPSPGAPCSFSAPPSDDPLQDWLRESGH